MPDAATKKRNQTRAASHHGITLEEKDWLAWTVQKGVCPVCLEPLPLTGLNIDHAHDCERREDHRQVQGRDCGCKHCIRGAIHERCNSTIVYYLERFPHLQNEHIKTYLARRPFIEFNALY